MQVINPGEELRHFLMSLYPRQNTHTSFFIDRIDHDLMSEGDLADIFYRSSINYLLRRLITTARYFQRMYSPQKYGQGRYQNELRQYFRDYTRFRDSHIDLLLPLLMRCLRTEEEKPPALRVTSLRRQAEAAFASCHICGRSLDYHKNSTSHLAASIDHIWPRSLGGVSEDHNLIVVCRHCNNELKRDFIDESDYHYEEMSMVALSYDEYTSKERNRRYEVAIFAKTDYRCSVCNQPASRVGELYIGRIEPTDSWHFMNLVGYCSEHKPD